MEDDPLARCTGFDWDDGNTRKNWDRHQVTPEEAEQVFFQDPLVLAEDLVHSTKEARFFALGKTANSRRLFVVFTVRGSLIRIISVRDMSKREREVYKRHEEADS